MQQCNSAALASKNISNWEGASASSFLLVRSSRECHLKEGANPREAFICIMIERAFICISLERIWTSLVDLSDLPFVEWCKPRAVGA